MAFEKYQTVSKNIKLKPKNIYSVVSGWGILLVVIGHSRGTIPHNSIELSQIDSLYGFYTDIIDWIYSFHMPLFFFISGFLFSKTNSGGKRINFREFFKKKLDRILLPYICLTLVAYPIKTLLIDYSVRPVAFSLTSLVSIFFFPFENPIAFFWFLPTIFIILVFAPFLLSIFDSRKKNISIIGVTFLFISLYYLSLKNLNLSILDFLCFKCVIRYIIFFWLGITCHRQIAFELRSNLLTTTTILLITIAVYILNSRVDFKLDLLVSILGILFSFALAYILFDHKLQFLDEIGQFSYQIFLLSWFPQVASRIIFSQILKLDIWISVFFMITLGLLIPIVISKAIYAYAPWYIKKIVGLSN